ncbi:MAG: TlpA disulfide reductase family protein [Myxococcaceae bacterium]
MCARELPELEKVRAEYQPKGVSFLALSMEPDTDAVTKAAAKLNIQMPVATTRQEVLDPLGAKRVPATVWIDSSGKIVTAASGERSLSFLEKQTEAIAE